METLVAQKQQFLREGMKQPRTNTISASLHAAILGVAVAFLIVPAVPAMAYNTDAPKLVYSIPFC